MEDKFYSLLGLSCRAGKAVLGFVPTQSAIIKNKVQMIIIAGDLSTHTREKIQRLARKRNVPLYETPNREDLARALGQENLGVVGITSREMAKALKLFFIR